MERWVFDRLSDCMLLPVLQGCPSYVHLPQEALCYAMERGLPARLISRYPHLKQSRWLMSRALVAAVSPAVIRSTAVAFWWPLLSAGRAAPVTLLKGIADNDAEWGAPVDCLSKPTAF